MVIHCTKKLADKLPEVSSTPVEEDSLVGSWHAHLYFIDRRQCVMFCHDHSRYVLFLAGLRKEHFSVLGGKWFRELYTASLQVLGCRGTQIRKAELSLGPVHFDTATDRSVQGSMRIARQDLDALIMRVPIVLNLDPLDVSARLNHRPARVYGKVLWPEKVMQELVEQL